MSGPTGIPRWVVFLVGIPYALIHPFKTLEVLREGWRNRDKDRTVWYRCKQCKAASSRVVKKGETAGETILLHCSQCHELHLFERLP